MTRVLVTGGSGFIGRTIVPGLTGLGYEVLSPRHAEVELLDADAVRTYLELHQPDVVVHSATKPGHRNAVDTTGIVESNLRMFFNLARDTALCPRMVFLSSGAVYGAEHYIDRMPETYFDEHVPADDHGFSKYVLAKYIERSSNIVELRVFGIFGPHEDYAIRFISNAACKALLGLPVTLRQDRWFSYLWVEDLLPVVAHFIEGGDYGRAYNVTPDEPSSLRSLGELVIATSGNDVPLRVASPGIGTPYTGDNSRLRDEISGLRFLPEQAAVSRLLRWYEARIDEIDRSLLLVDR